MDEMEFQEADKNVRDLITDVLISFLELHLVHTFTFVPMQESFSFEECAELGSKTLEDCFQCRRVNNDSCAQLGVITWSAHNTNLEVVWNPFNNATCCLVFL